jgi:hypothetical protein
MQQLPIEITLCNYPQHEAGGDSTAFFLTPSNELLAIVMDVSGHDLRAAIISAYFQGMLRGNIDAGQPLTKILANFNWYLVKSWAEIASQAGNSPGITSLSVCTIRWDLNTNSFASLNSGFPCLCSSMPPATLGTAAVKAVTLSVGLNQIQSMSAIGARRPENGYSSGPMDYSILPTPWRSLRSVRPIVCCSEELGMRPEMVEDAIDDILLVDMLVPPADGRPKPEFPLVVEQYERNQLRQIDTLQQRWQRSLQTALPLLAEHIVMDVLLCTREAVINALLHGCHERNPLPESGEHHCSLRILVNPDESLIRVSVADSGPGHSFDASAHAEVAAEELLVQHRGLILINQVPCRTTSARNGASLEMSFSLHRPLHATCNQNRLSGTARTGNDMPNSPTLIQSSGDLLSTTIDEFRIRAETRHGCSSPISRETSSNSG